VSRDEETRELPVQAPDDGSPEADEPSPDLGSWGTDAVPLGGVWKRERATSGGRARTPQPAARRWVALAAVACSFTLIAMLSASALKLDSPTTTSDQGTARAEKEPPAAQPNVQGAQAGMRAPGQTDHQQRTTEQRARIRTRRGSTAPPRTTPSAPSAPAPSSTYTPDRESAPPPEPGAPSYAPAPAASAPSPTAKPPAASGAAVAEEFGFER